MKPVSRERRAVSPVIAIVLLVAITTVLAAVVYVTVSSIVGSVEVTPYVYMTVESSNSTEAVIGVTGIESEHTHLEYMAVLIVNGTRDDSSTMKPLYPGTVGNITYIDLGDDKFSIGDEFEVATEPGKSYQLAVIFVQNGNRAGYVEWQT